MKRPVVLVSLALCAAGLLILLAAWPREREPEYKGKSLTQLLVTLQDTMGEKTPTPAQLAAQRTSVNGILAIGTNAPTWLVQWIVGYKPTWSEKVYHAMVALPRPISRMFYKAFGAPLVRTVKHEPRELAGLGFLVLREKGSSAVPGLTKCLKDPESTVTQRTSALRALSRIGKAGFPTMLEAINDKDGATQKEAASCVCTMTRLGEEARPALPEVIIWLRGNDRGLAGKAAFVLGEWHIEPEVVVPALAEAFQANNGNTWLVGNSAEALGKFGAEAKSAVPILVGRLDDSNSQIRTAATNALRKISPESMSNQPSRLN